MSGGKFQYKRVLQLVSGEERQLQELNRFLQRIGSWQMNGLTKMTEGARLMEGRSRLSNKELMRQLGELSINRIERERCELTYGLVKEKLLLQVQEGFKSIRGIKERAKVLQGRKDSLTAQQIEGFKKLMREELINANRRKQQTIKMYCRHTVKINCEYLQTLTSTMQRQHDKQLQRKQSK